MSTLVSVMVLLVGLLVGPLGPGPSGWVRPEPSEEGSWPLLPRPQVVRGFDPPSSPWGAGHRGVDLLGAAGTPVRAALPGRVAFAGRIAGRGVVVVDHGGRRTTYEPVAATVAVGARVLAGQQVGTLQRGSSHCFPRACLHWGLIRGETYLDPLTLVGAGPVRLLPLSGGAAPSGAGPGGLMPAGGRAGRPGAAVPW